MNKLESAKGYITEQFKESGDSSWLEGWICGYTDPEHERSGDDLMKEELFDHLRELRKVQLNKPLHTVKELIDHLVNLNSPERQVIFDYDGNTTDVGTMDIQVWDESDDESPVAIYCPKF